MKEKEKDTHRKHERWNTIRKKLLPKKTDGGKKTERQRNIK